MKIVGSAKVPPVPTREDQVPAQAATVPPPPAARVAAAPRQWRMRSILAAAMIVLLGGLVLAWAVPAYSKRDQVLVLAQDVRAGETLTAGDLVRADLSIGPPISAVKLADADQVLGRMALSDLPKGAVLTRGQVGTSRGLAQGQVLVPLPLKAGRLPARGVGPGQQVLVVPAPESLDAPAAKAISGTAPIRATVVESGTMDPSSGVTVVDVQVPQDQGAALAQLAGTGAITLVALPPGSSGS